MGQDESLPDLPHNENHYELQNQSVTHIPYRIPPEHVIKTLLLNHNSLQSFPLRLANVETIDVSYNDLEWADLLDTIVDYPQLSELIMSSCNIKRLPASAVNLTKLKRLDLDKNKLSDGAFDFSTLSMLENLDLLLNFYSQMPPLPQSIDFLDIGFNNIRVLGGSLPNLVHLRMPGNGLTEILRESRFENLRKLVLSLNDLVEIPDLELITPLLEELDVSNNCLISFPMKLPKTIKYLCLSHNMISDGDASLELYTNLSTIDISYNLLTELPQMPSSIAKIVANNNKIARINAICPTSTCAINLSSNELSELPDLSQSRISNLLLSKNKLESIDFSRLPSDLSNLELSRNRITLLFNLSCLTKLQTLILSSNQITQIPDDIRSTNISSLNISMNPISELPVLPSSLQVLHAGGCKLTSIPDVIVSQPHFNLLDLSFNSITSIPALPDVQNLILAHNKITRIPELPDSLSVLDLSHNQLTKFEVEGEEVMLQELNLSHNSISKFIYPNVNLIQSLNVSFNPLAMSLDLNKVSAAQRIDITQTKITVTGKPSKSLKELLTSEASLLPHTSTHKVRLMNCIACGYSDFKGCRTSMEDAMIIRSQIVPNLDVYAVIDGHGGGETSSLTATILPELFTQSPDKSITCFPRFIREVNEQLRKKAIKDGATIVFALISKDKISCAYLGDSRAVMVYKDGSSKTLTCDHKPTDRGELAMLKDNRTYVDKGRTSGILAVSRALGDFQIEGVSRIPDIRTFERTKNDYRLVLACDGVFDVLEEEDVAKLVLEYPSPSEAAAAIRFAAFASGSQDNISVLVVNIEK